MRRPPLRGALLLAFLSMAHPSPAVDIDWALVSPRSTRPAEGSGVVLCGMEAWVAGAAIAGSMRMAARGGARFIFVAIAANTNDYTLFTSVGNPADRVAVTCTVNGGVTVGSTSVLTAAWNTGAGWALGSSLRLVNYGVIAGRSGQGGGGGWSPARGGTKNGSDGSAGGPAIRLGWPITIDNSGGYIFGGGGGGGGGGAADDGGANFFSGGGGGGGGGAGVTSNVSFGGYGLGSNSPSDDGANGADGTAGGPGAGGAGGPALNPGGDGGAGGAFGAAGAAGGAGGGGFGGWGGAGGAAGRAVDLQGHAVAWTGGYNGSQVRGAVS